MLLLYCATRKAAESPRARLSGPAAGLLVLVRRSPQHLPVQPCQTTSTELTSSNGESRRATTTSRGGMRRSGHSRFATRSRWRRATSSARQSRSTGVCRRRARTPAQPDQRPSLLPSPTRAAPRVHTYKLAVHAPYAYVSPGPGSGCFPCVFLPVMRKDDAALVLGHVLGSREPPHC